MKGLWIMLAGILIVYAVSGQIEKSTLNQLVQALGNGKVDVNGIVIIDRIMKSSMESAFKQYMLSSGESDANVVINSTMQRAIATAEAEVYSIAKRLQLYLGAKNKKHEEIAKLRNIIAENQFPAEFIYTDDNFKALMVIIGSREEASSLLHKLESMLQALTEVSQQLQLQLQDAKNKQQQLSLTISNIMKNAHDTMKAIIQNLR